MCWVHCRNSPIAAINSPNHHPNKMDYGCSSSSSSTPEIESLYKHLSIGGKEERRYMVWCWGIRGRLCPVIARNSSPTPPTNPPVGIWLSSTTCWYIFLSPPSWHPPPPPPPPPLLLLLLLPLLLKLAFFSGLSTAFYASNYSYFDRSMEA